LSVDVFYLVALDTPNFDDPSFNFNQFIIVGAIEDCASIRPVVALDVNAWGIRFGEIDTLVSLSA